VILDEPDSGLDVDAVKVVAQSIDEYHDEAKAGMLLITHYGRMLSHMKPKFVHVIVDGRIVREGGPELIEEIEKKGYKS
jgi:Fe-S cluster assembly ATP-binding protein